VRCIRSTVGIVLSLTLFRCSSETRQANVMPTTTRAASSFDLISTAFENGSVIPRKFTEDGQNVSPPLQWNAAPPGVKEFALVVDDRDAPHPVPWVHWLLYRIPGTTTGLPEGIPPAERPANPPRARQGMNSWEKIGYRGPAPPRGHGVHHYHFRLHALDVELKLDPRMTRDDLVRAIQGHVLAEAELIGTYQRP
jgi:Raf kinase inhibitor-like YbhB/YbcL family protein